MANNDDMMATMNGDQTPLSNNLFLRWLSKKLNPNAASAPDTSDLDNPMVGGGDDGGNAGYNEGSHERDNEGADNSRAATSSVPALFAFASKPSPDMANDQPKPASQPVNLEKAGHLPRSRQDDFEQRKANVQFRPGAMPGVVLEGDENVPLYEKQANQYGPVETSDTNSKASASVPPLFLNAAAAASKPSNPADTANEIAAGAEDETGNDLPVLAPQGSSNRFLRTVQRLLGFAGDTPEPGQKYDPASAESHKVASGILGRLANVGASIGYPQTDPRELRLKQQEIKLELARLEEDINWHRDMLGERDQRTQALVGHYNDLRNEYDARTAALQAKPLPMMGEDGKVHLMQYNPQSNAYDIDRGLAEHQPAAPKESAPKTFVMGSMTYRWPTADEQAQGKTDPVVIGPAPTKSGGRGAAGSIDQLKPTKGPNGNIISVYDPATKTNWFPQDIQDPNMPFYVQKFLTNAAANKKEDRSSSKKTYTPKF